MWLVKSIRYVKWGAHKGKKIIKVVLHNEKKTGPTSLLPYWPLKYG